MPISLLAFRRTFFAASLTLLVMLVLWWILWSVAAAQYRGVIDNWIEAEKSVDRQFSYDDRWTTGFPHRVALHFMNVRWRNAEGVTLHADEAMLSATPWEWRTFDAKFKYGAEVSIPFENQSTVTLTGTGGHGHAELDGDNQWRMGGLQLINVKVSQTKTGQSQANLFGADEMEVNVERPKEQPKDHTQPGLNLTGSAETIVLPNSTPSPFGLELAKVETNFRVMGPMPDFRKKESVAAWNSENGVVEFDNLYLEWGPLTLEAKGTMGFDDDLQPEGAFSGQVGNHEKVLKALLDHDYIEKREAGMLNSALNLFAKPSRLGSSPGIEVPIIVQLGGLFLGPVRIFTFPDLYWSEETKPASP